VFDEKGLATQPALGADGTIYLGYSKKLYAIGPDGEKKWVFVPDRVHGEYDRLIAPPVVDKDGDIFFAASYLVSPPPDSPAISYALDSQGKLKWRLKLPTGVTAVALGPGGTLYVGGGRLLCCIVDGRG